MVVPGGVRLADALMDRPGSYMVGRAQVSWTARNQCAAPVHTILRWPDLTDPHDLGDHTAGLAGAVRCMTVAVMRCSTRRIGEERQ